MHFHNMVTGKELVAGQADQKLSAPIDGDRALTTEHKAAFPVRSLVKLYRVIKSRVPIGYEDEEGFHYGADLAS